MKKLRDRLTDKLPLVTMVLFVIQPLMDVLSFWLQKWGASNAPTLALRLLVLVAAVAAGFLLEPKKRIYCLAAAVCLVVGLGHVLACAQAGYQNVLADLSNYVRVLQLPLMTLVLMTFLRVNGRCYPAMKKALAIDLTIILAVQVLAVVTGTEPRTYFDGTGFLGWFSNANTQSAIVSMIAPVAAVWSYGKKGFRSIVFWVLFGGACLSMYLMGPRLTYVGLLALCFGLGASVLLIRLKDWKRAAVFLLAGALFIGLFPLSPMMRHRKIHSDHMDEKNDWIGSDMQGPPVSFDRPTEEDPMEGEPLLVFDEPLELTEEQKARIEELAPIYRHYMSDFVAIFGVERTIHLYNYTDDIRIMSATREKKLMFADILMEMSPASARLFGVELSRFTINGNTYDVENDFHGIYYLYGAVGLAALALFLAWFLWRIVRALVCDFRRYFTLEAAGWGIALVMALGHALFTAGVLRRPSASFYLAAVLAAVYHLTDMKRTPQIKDEVK